MGKHIALLCMSLNIGGAETHIFELAKGLTAKGHTVTVFSNGGVYAKALEEIGIRHVQAPLHRKNLFSLIKSYGILKREFSQNFPSVVHSHTRISNYVGGLVCNKLHIPMVTTVHGHFRSDFFFRLFTRWGCRSLAVSDDLREYLINDYNYPAEHVQLTVNGIDLTRFQKKALPEFRRSLGVEDHQKIILMVTRLEKETAKHVSMVFDLAPSIYRQAPDSRIVLVGDGKLFAQFQKEAAEINQQCGTDYILMQGGKTNIEQYTAVSDLFIGISRAALEAMAASLPVILLGNHGYLGLYSHKIRQESTETNLTCRGYPYPDSNEISSLIVDCLTNKDLSQNIEDGVQLVKERYSIETMATNAEHMYREAINSFRPLDYMISGYYGTDNFGDNLTLRILMDHLKDRKGTFLTHNIKNTDAPSGVLKIHRFHLWTIRKLMKKTKVFLLGSGSILQDATSNRSIFYYHYILRMALRYHCKVMLYANGVGPISNTFNRIRTTQLLNRIDLITARDQESIDLLKNLSIHCPTVLTADDVFSLQFGDRAPLDPVKEAAGKTLVGVNFKLEVRETKRINAIADALKELAEKHQLFYYLIPFHQEQDTPALKLLNKKLPRDSYLVKATNDPQKLIHYMQLCEYQIFERFHGQVIGTILGTPFLPINYDPKNYSLAVQMGMEDYLINHTDITKERIVETFERLQNNRHDVKEKMAAYANNARMNAKMNCEYLLKMIEDF
ncbi:MAG: polysaccharide pyruvyl transferase CsaB [Clostridia bacterium]|nr:polysaccharide pyruvyl transferase CsaB [Clostridia bacterium]